MFTDRLIKTTRCRYSSNVRFGSLAAPLANSSSMSASEGKADVIRFNFGSLRLDVRFSPKRTLLPRRNSNFQGPLSAISGPSRSMENYRFHGDVTLLRIFATCGCRCFLCEQFRKTRIRVLGNDVGKGLHFNVLVVESGLGSSQVMMPEMPKRCGYCGIYCKGLQSFSFD